MQCIVLTLHKLVQVLGKNVVQVSVTIKMKIIFYFTFIVCKTERFTKILSLF